MDPLSQVFCLKWNNHQNNLLTVLDHLYQTEAFCDVTLACDNTSIKCHKMILSACSSYFQSLFMENTCEHPIVFLKDIKIGEVRAILDYMYKGEVNVAQEELPGLLKVAELLRVKGLVEGGDNEKLLNSNYHKNGRPIVTTSMNEPPTSSSKLNGGNEAYRQERTSSLSDSQPREPRDSSKDSPREMPRFLPAGMPMPMFPIPGMFPNLLGGARDPIGRSNSLNRGGNDDGGDSSTERDGSPSPPGSSQKRRKVASGSPSSKDGSGSGLGLGREQAMALDLGRDREDKAGMPDDFDKDMLPLPPGLDKSGIANYVPSQRLEWKRYKQYTRNDIMSAIEAVKNGMSALQASRKYGVPSRTLYDKVKKMGITTGRQVQQRKSLPNYPSQFPGLSGMMGMNDMDDREDTNDSSLGTPGEEPSATMVPPTSLSTYMLNIMKGMQPDHGSKSGSNGGVSGVDSNEISLTPMNLSKMLSSHAKHHQLGHAPDVASLSPHSPRPHQRDLDDDMVDSTEPGHRGHRGRHSSGDEPSSSDIKSQLLADLRRLGGNLPSAPSSSAVVQAENPHVTSASSTTHSPPSTASDENNLPPRKRKVSQEHVTRISDHSDNIQPRAASPYNGIHDQQPSQQDPEDNPKAEQTEQKLSLDCRN